MASSQLCARTATLVIAAVTLATPGAQSPNTLSATERAAGWRLLFDGTTTGGWHVYGRPGSRPSTANGWDVKDGTLVALGRGTDSTADIASDDDFASFELLIDWKIAPQANSGIFFHVVEQGYDAIYATGPEYQLIDDDGWKGPLEAWQKTGANYAMHPPLAKAYKAVGEWNHTRILVDGARVEHWLNGVKTAAYELWTPEWQTLKTTGKWKDYPGYGIARTGKLGLQNHDNMVWFRDIKIRPR